MQWNIIVLMSILPFLPACYFSSCRWKMMVKCSIPWTMATRDLRIWSSWWSFINSIKAFFLASWNIIVLELHFSQTRSDLLNCWRKRPREKKKKTQKKTVNKSENIAMVKRIYFTSKLQKIVCVLQISKELDWHNIHHLKFIS